MANIFSVSNSEDLRSALVSAEGGDTIKLAGGDYGQLDLLTFKTFGVKAIYDSPVTITSADPDDRASFSGMDLREVKNLTFDNVEFDSDYTGGSVWVSPFKVKDSEGITIRNSLFEGELASGTGDPDTDGFATGKGLRVGGSSDVVIENNEFSTWHRGLIISGSTDVRVTGNDVHSMRSDGMNFIQVEKTLIEDNHIHDFVRAKGSGDHADFIQFWTNGTSKPSADIVIRGNTLDVGDGDGTQSIFMRNDMVDRGLAGEEMFYRNILIEENVILNNHSHGITVGETDGLVIRNNSVLDADETISASVATPKINVKPQSTNVVIEQNATAAISDYGDQPDWAVSNNALVQNTDVNAEGFYASEFIESSMSGEAIGYINDPNGTIAQLDAGASRLHLDLSPDNLRTAFDVSNDPNSENALIFDAGYTRGPDGLVTDSDAEFVWDFGDGTSATGPVVRHAYVDAGRYEATLTVVMPDGTTSRAESEIAIMGADMLSYDPATGLFQAEGYGTTTAIADSDKASVATADGHGIDLGASGSQVGIGKEHLSRLFGADSFDMSMTLHADTLGSTGEVARVHTNFLLSIAPRGEVSFQLWTDTQSKTLTTTGVTVNDGADHDIRIAFDGETSSLMIYVDDQLAGATEVEGNMRSDFPRSLGFGNPWGKQNFDGTLTAFDLEVGNQDFPDYKGNLAAIPGEVEPISVPAVDNAGEDNAAEPKAPDTEPSPDESAAPETVEDPVDEAPEPQDNDTPDNTEPPSDDATQPEQDRTDVPVDDASAPLYTADFARIGTDESDVKLIGDTHVVQNADGGAEVMLDGNRDFVALGRIEELEDSQQFNLSLDFQRSNVDSGEERLVWNHAKFGITLQGDALLIHVANTDLKVFEIANAGVGNTDKHSLSVAVDAEADRLQVVLDGEVLLDKHTDLDFVGAGGQEWGWSIGTAWNRYYEGSVSAFELDDEAVFVDGAAELKAPDTEPSPDESAAPETVEDPVDEAPEPQDNDTPDNTEPPSDDATQPEQDRTDVPVDDASAPLYTADFARIGTDESDVKLIGDTHVVQNADGGAEVMLDGNRDFVALGRIEELEDSQQFNLSLDFQRSDVDGGAERLVWNHMKFGITLKDDALLIHVANTDQPFHKAFKIANAGVGDTDKHSLSVAVDAEADRLQVVLDGEMLLDNQDTDLDFVGAGGHEWGWSIGTAWNRYYEGSVSAFELDDEAVFVDDAAALL